jgi:hypothetical protein
MLTQKKAMAKYGETPQRQPDLVDIAGWHGGEGVEHSSAELLRF